MHHRSDFVSVDAQQGMQANLDTDPQQNPYEKVLLTASSGFIGIGGFATGIAEGHIADKVVRAIPEGIKGVKLLGRSLTGVGMGLAMYQLYSGNGDASDYARFGGSLIITGSAAIPIAGKFVSLGLGIADAAGAFEGLYKSFDSPAMQVFYLDVLKSGGRLIPLKK